MARFMLKWWVGIRGGDATIPERRGGDLEAMNHRQRGRSVSSGGGGSNLLVRKNLINLNMLLVEIWWN